MKMKNYKDFKKKLLKDREIEKAYDELDLEFALVERLIEKRLQEGLTQKELAKKIGTKQPAIARFEKGKGNPTFKFLYKIASALDTKLRISIP